MAATAQMVSRRNALIREANAEIRSRNALHDRATEAHVAARLAALDALSRAGRTIAPAAARLTDRSYPTSDWAAVERAAEALDPEVSKTSDATDAVIEAVLGGAGETMALRRHVGAVERAASCYEQERAESAEAGGAAAGPGGIEAPTGPAEDLDGWALQVVAATQEVERHAAEAEVAAAGSGGRTDRLLACNKASHRTSRARARDESLATGGGRPRFVPVAGRRAAFGRVRDRDEAAHRRAIAALQLDRGRGPRRP